MPPATVNAAPGEWEDSGAPSRQCKQNEPQHDAREEEDEDGDDEARLVSLEQLRGLGSIDVRLSRHLILHHAEGVEGDRSRGAEEEQSARNLTEGDAARAKEPDEANACGKQEQRAEQKEDERDSVDRLVLRDAR